MKNREIIYIVLSVIILLVLSGGAYWYFLMGPVTAPQSKTSTTTNALGGFQPLGRPSQTGQSSNTASTGGNGSESPTNTAAQSSSLATLRLLSSTPVGGYGASTTAKTTIVRWVDRGRGNVYEVSYDSTTVTTLSNTVVPRIYNSSWNKNLTAFVASIFPNNDSPWAAVYTQLTPQSSTTDATQQVTPFALRGKKLPSNLIGYAISPKKDKLFMLTNDGGAGIGYVSNLDGSGVTRIFSTPVTQVNIDWPSDNIISITTKGSASLEGYAYFVNPKTGSWTRILGPIPGLSTSVSHDGKYMLWSGAGKDGTIVTGLYSIEKKASSDSSIMTLADKCAWGNLYTTIVYCAVPSSVTSGTYPDDWYTGKVSDVDNIWQIDAATGVTTQLSSLISKADRSINAFNLGLDPKDSYLLFMNKNDLSLWSISLDKAR
jgi:hypothetical protein